MVIVLLFSLGSTSYACDENQSNDYVTQILFGDRAVARASDDKTRMLMAALYLCSEQADNQGQDKVDYLKQKKVAGVPALKDVNIKSSELFVCSHLYWEYEYPASKKIRANRKKVLRNTVNKIFDFGFVNNIFGSSKGKCDSFAAFLYYSHILADYLEDIPEDTEVIVNGNYTPVFTDKDYIILNNDVPKFTNEEIARAKTTSFIEYSSLDQDPQNRAGVVMASIGPDTLAFVGGRNMPIEKPTGWSSNTYPGVVNSTPPYLFNKCHLLAHSLGGKDKLYNLVTGTRYMNEKMDHEVESKVKKYIEDTQNKVLYRATPIYKGSNELCSGILLEAYSLDDNGASLHFNRFFYNVQPNIVIDYSTGDNYYFDESKIIPFAVLNPSDNNRDFISEMEKHLEVLFEEQKKTGTYISMKNELNAIAYEARATLNSGKSDIETQKTLNKCQREYYSVLRNYIPKLLEREEFFNKTFI